MKVIRARVLGFCMGVRRAVDLASREAASSFEEGASAGKGVYTLGPLIHNPRVLRELESLGVRPIAELPPNLDGASLVIRAHGISPHAEAELRGRGGRIVDATCPKVKASQLKAKALAEAGCRLFLAGEAEHAEIAGIRGYALAGAGTGGFCAVVGGAAEAEEAAAALFAKEPNGKTALIGQTTISPEEYASIGEGIKKYFPALEIIQTICAATTERQDALRELLDQVDAVIVAGGRESANTRRLLAIAAEGGKPRALVEDAAGIPPDFAAFSVVGLCAGASTPDSCIDEIEQALLGGTN